jgi:hypothetical protein
MVIFEVGGLDRFLEEGQRAGYWVKAFYEPVTGAWE